jgi:hypothetical protein
LQDILDSRLELILIGKTIYIVPSLVNLTLIFLRLVVLTMRIRHEYSKREAQKAPQDRESRKICHCNTLVLIVDKTHHAVYREHFNHCPSKSSNLNLVAPDVLRGSTNWQVLTEGPLEASRE